jgi:hypothetical protein
MLARMRYLSLLFMLILGLTLAGCGVSEKQYSEIQTKLDKVQNDYATATAQLSSMQKELDATKTQLPSAQSDYNAMKSQLASAQNEIKQLQDKLASQSVTLDEAQNQVSHLNAILDTKTTHYYQFSFQAVSYRWDLPVALRLYFDYKGKSRPNELSKYGTMVTDAGADATISVLVNKVKDAATNYDLRKSDIVNLVAKFVQTLPGTNKNVTTPYDAYPRYPLETLFDQGGDSQDTSILAAALLRRLDYDVVLFSYDSPKHMAVGVNIPGSLGYGWEFQAKRYFYLETTGEGLLIGDCPPEYRQPQPIIYPLGS